MNKWEGNEGNKNEGSGKDGKGLGDYLCRSIWVGQKTYECARRIELSGKRRLGAGAKGERWV